jgi:putative PIN family toxin of toxin-antitoxin system
VRVVFDSNIYISALTLPGGRADQALQRTAAGSDQLVLSKTIIDEVLTVLANKFSRDKEQIARVAIFLADLGDIVIPRRRISVLSDEADNRILECAVTGKANCVVTGDRALLRLGEYEGIRIVTLRSYLDQF